jgi:hypothetical protein
MNRKTLLAGAVFAGLTLIAVVTLRSPEKGVRTKTTTNSPIPAIAKDAMDTLEVTKAGATTVIKKTGDTYALVKPLAFPADTDAAKAAFEAFEKLVWEREVSNKKARHAEYEVGDDSLRVVAKKGDAVLADLRVGKSANQSTLVRLDGKDEVWSVSGLQKYQVDKDATAWRDKSLTTFAEKDAEKLTVAAKDGSKIVLEKPAPTDAGAPADWRMVESTLKIDKLDKTIASGMISQLANWKANEFADAAKPEETGLDTPALTITVGLAGGKTLTALIGNKKGEEDTYVKLADKPQVFVVKKWGLDRLNKRPIEFRDKTICDLASGELTEVAVTHGADTFTLAKAGADWKLAKPAGATLDTSKVAGITGAFADWKAQSFAEDPKLAGLAKPTSTISAKGAKGRACQLKVGAETPEKNSFFVQVGGQPDVYVVQKWSLDRVLVKLDDLKKK